MAPPPRPRIESEMTSKQQHFEAGEVVMDVVHTSVTSSYADLANEPPVIAPPVVNNHPSLRLHSSFSSSEVPQQQRGGTGGNYLPRGGGGRYPEGGRRGGGRFDRGGGRSRGRFMESGRSLESRGGRRGGGGGRGFPSRGGNRFLPQQQVHQNLLSSANRPSPTTTTGNHSIENMRKTADDDMAEPTATRVRGTQSFGSEGEILSDEDIHHDGSRNQPPPEHEMYSSYSYRRSTSPPSQQPPNSMDIDGRSHRTTDDDFEEGMIPDHGRHQDLPSRNIPPTPFSASPDEQQQQHRNSTRPLPSDLGPVFPERSMPPISSLSDDYTRMSTSSSLSLRNESAVVVFSNDRVGEGRAFPSTNEPYQEPPPQHPGSAGRFLGDNAPPFSRGGGRGRGGRMMTRGRGRSSTNFNVAPSRERMDQEPSQFMAASMNVVDRPSSPSMSSFSHFENESNFESGRFGDGRGGSAWGRGMVGGGRRNFRDYSGGGARGDHPIGGRIFDGRKGRGPFDGRGREARGTSTSSGSFGGRFAMESRVVRPGDESDSLGQGNDDIIPGRVRGFHNDGVRDDGPEDGRSGRVFDSRPGRGRGPDVGRGRGFDETTGRGGGRLARGFLETRGRGGRGPMHLASFGRSAGPTFSFARGPSPSSSWQKRGPSPHEGRSMDYQRDLTEQNELTSPSNVPRSPSPPSASKASPENVSEQSALLSSSPIPRDMTPPPEASEPSALVLALTRLADLEAQMEYEFTKYTQLVQRHKRIRAEFEVLEKLPVGMEAFQEDFDKLLASEKKT